MISSNLWAAFRNHPCQETVALVLGTVCPRQGLKSEQHLGTLGSS